ncbi:hypothetical protein BCR32DRAFT_281628 [Anaeromyces robustus]|uniref:Uncharacterized protein n=1 Tax=Anaeromyces robustus TaxID=1754192 RepID=A0A1Y1X0K2_9FUNG|nr:hypothetical protein BCR32DRAFT_281628 [Anaeromyces robustus]|eukprot:ORX79185.1 hypothetical protein BCR32DRAFT_281628 [Anaeromyces robustus]
MDVLLNRVGLNLNSLKYSYNHARWEEIRKNDIKEHERKNKQKKQKKLIMKKNEKVILDTKNINKELYKERIDDTNRTHIIKVDKIEID